VQEKEAHNKLLGTMLKVCSSSFAMAPGAQHTACRLQETQQTHAYMGDNYRM
jgi:hypothetical protein